MKYEHTQLVYEAQVGDIALDRSNFIDLTRGLALINGKNCNQFSKKDKPYLVTASVRLSEPDETLHAAKNSWMVRNACVKAAAAWRRTLRSAGIRGTKRLNTYAKFPRLAFNGRHSQYWSEFDTANATFADLIPADVPASYTSDVYDSTGTAIIIMAYNSDPTLAPWSSSRVKAFTQTTFAVPQSGATDVLDKKANLLGDVDGTYCNIVAEYIDSRINDADEEDTDMDTSPSNDNDFVMMLAPGEEVADDVLDVVDDEGRWRPYSMATSNSSCQIISPGANVAGQPTTIHAPLGLLEWKAKSVNSLLIVDILAITEM